MYNLSFLPGGITFDEAHTRLLFYELTVRFVRNHEHGWVNHQAFVVSTAPGGANSGSASSNQTNWSKDRSNNGGNKGRNNNCNNNGRNNNG